MVDPPPIEEPHDPRARASEWPRLTRFDLIRRIGEGGSGLVYEAHDRERDVRVALKMLRVPDADQLLQLKEEFRSLQDIEHTNLIRLFELVNDEGTWFFTMELVVGKNFLEHVASATPGDDGARRSDRPRTDSQRPSRPFDATKLGDALVQLVRGLSALHAAGKVHRDIKPSNVLVSSDGRVVILDLGLVLDTSARHAADLDEVVGSMIFAAPEQAAGEQVGPPADWYAVGSVLYHCLTGRPPFVGTLTQVMEQKWSRDPPRPRDIVPDIDPDLDALCMDLLSRDPAARPTGRDILRRLRLSDASELSSLGAGAAPFVGRTAETALLAEAFGAATCGEAVTMIVEGESGVGKSVLVRRFASSLEERADVLVLTGRCYEREDVPYKAIDGVMDTLSTYLAELPIEDVQSVIPPSAFVLRYAFPVLARVPGVNAETAPTGGGIQESRAELFYALREVLTNLARIRRLVIVIDDLQWADSDSLAALAHLLRPPSPPLLLVATARSRVTTADAAAPGDAIVPGERTFGLPGDVRVLPLQRLSSEEGLGLVTLLAGDMPLAVVTRIAREAAGHPLFVDELVRYAQLMGGQTAEAVHLEDALVARVSRLDQGPNRLMTMLSIAGVGLSQEVAMRALGVAFDEFSSSVQALLVAHLAKTHGRRGKDLIEPYHDRVREAVTSRLSAEERALCHRQLAEALEKAEAQDADALALHWFGAGEGARGTSYALAAADQALAAVAFETAARHFERALSSGTLDDATRRAVLVKVGEALAHAGRGAEAAKAYLEAASGSPPDVALDLRRRAAEELLTAGRLDDGEVVLRDVLRAVDIALPRTPWLALLGLLLCRLVLTVRGLGFVERKAAQVARHRLTRVDACTNTGRVLGLVDNIRGAYFQARGLIEALRAGEPTRIAAGLCSEAVFSATNGKDAYASTLLAKAKVIAERSGDIQSLAFAEIAAGFTEFVLGHFGRALEPVDRGDAMLREHCPGAYWDRRTGQNSAIFTLGWMGNLNDLSTRVEARVRDASFRGDLFTATTLRAGVPNLAWLRTDDASHARSLVLDAMRQWTQRGYHSQHYWCLLALARIDLYEGDARAAYGRVQSQWPRILRSLMLAVRMIRVEAIHLRGSTALAVAAERSGRGRAAMLRAAARDARALERTKWAHAAPHAHLIRAAIAAMSGDADGAARVLELAVRGFEDGAMLLHANAARFHLGRLRGDTVGRQLTADAEAWMTAQGVMKPGKMAGMLAPGFRR